MGSMSLPPGFRFHPTDDELVGYYLKKKVDGQAIELEVIPVIDLYKFDPWDLPEKSFLPKRDLEWFFFCPRDKKYPNGSRTNRATTSGYWKATGKDRKVFCESSVQGLRKTLVFYCGRAPGGERTDWVMHEYRLCEDLNQATPNFLGAFALCRVVKRSEQGLKMGDFPGESSKGKRSLPSAPTNFVPRKNFSKVSSPSEEDSPKAPSLFEINSDSPPITSVANENAAEMQPVVAETEQTGMWGFQYLCDPPPQGYALDQSFFADPIHPTQFPNSTEACPSSSLSPVSSYASFTEETFLLDELNAHGSFPSFPSPLHHMNFFCNGESMDLQDDMNVFCNGAEAWNTMPYPQICRQASDAEDASLWLLEDSLLVVN